MAICRFCKRDMLCADGCVRVTIISGGNEHEPIKVGEGNDFSSGEGPNARCGDCNALMRHYHHPGCDNERCPVCGGQMLTCGCVDK